MSIDEALYGTKVPPDTFEKISCGKLTLTLQNGALRHIKYDGIELIRGIAFLVRDADWGTLEPKLVEAHRNISDNVELGFQATFENGGATLCVDLTVAADQNGLLFEAKGSTAGDFETNRTGFTVLHPASAAGCSVQVTHSDGSSESSTFPLLIDPWQPFVDIVKLEHNIQGISVLCALGGDVFEMEDQRQWGDASFKTYNRPLSLPWPYSIADQSEVVQSVAIQWRSTESIAPANVHTKQRKTTFPQTALVLTAEDARRLEGTADDLTLVGPQRLLCHVDASLPNSADQIAAFSSLQQSLSVHSPSIAYDLELIAAFDGDVEEELTRHAEDLRRFGFNPQSVMVCPSVDRQSTPPGSEWPACPPLDVIHAVGRKVFGQVSYGGGMASLFTELNRKRPPVKQLDFVSHSLCPIVHAADDVSVMETLETISHITRTAQSFIGSSEYRIGPATIAMRQNPYGSRTIPNPQLGRTCMTHDDPRHRAAFGAAYAIGLATALAPAGIGVWTPSALYGPRGLIGDEEPWPIAKAIQLLAQCSGKTIRQAEIKQGRAILDFGDICVVANLTAELNLGLSPFEWSSGQRDDIVRP